MLEAIWQVMPELDRRTEPGPHTATSRCRFCRPSVSLQAGDVLWTDVSITYAGYCSDFGRTWLVGEDPSARQQDQSSRSGARYWTQCSRSPRPA